MTKQGGRAPGNDGHGYDPAAAALGDLFGNEHADRLEQKSPGLERIKAPVPALGRTAKGLLKAQSAIMDRTGPVTDIDFQHSVFCQTGLPYKPTSARVWERQQGNASLRIEAGSAYDPSARRWVDLSLPHGEKPRLVLIHLNNEALRTGSPVVDVHGSMTAFVRALEIDTNGRNLKAMKDQLGRLAAALIRLALVEDGRAVQVDTKIIGAFDLWFPKDEYQRVLWPSTVRLSDDYFGSLTRHAVPLDHTAVAALKGSALCLDIYAWLAQRLYRVPKNRGQLITWSAMKAQFGAEYGRLDNFRANFIPALRHVLAVYPGAKVTVDEVGVRLFNSLPPVHRRVFRLPKLGPVIDGEAVPVHPPGKRKPRG
jgi:hypothetical protein